MLQLQADLCHHPAQGAGQGQHEQGDQRHQHHAPQDDARGDGHGEPVDDDGGQDHDDGIHQAHQVHAQQAGGHDDPHGNGQGQQQVVVLGQIQAGIGVEHAAEGPQQDGQQAHDDEIQPRHIRRRQRRAQGYRQEGEHAPQQAYHQQEEQHDIGDGAAAGAGFVFLGVVEVAAEDLQQLLF